VDESHNTLPQVQGQYFGDRARKETLVDFGFRLPSALDNRPLTFEEFDKHIRQAIFVIASHRTSGEFADQVNGACRIRTSNNEVANGDQPIGRAKPNQGQQVFEFVSTTVQITDDDRARHDATVFNRSWPASGSPRCPRR